MTAPSPYQMGYIGLRLRKVGKAGAMLKRQGWMKFHHAELNNRNGFDYVLPVQCFSHFELRNWAQLSALGAEGLAFWFTDAQHMHNAPLTDKQWQHRRIIERDFNQQWPMGIRPA